MSKASQRMMTHSSAASSGARGVDDLSGHQNPPDFASVKILSRNGEYAASDEERKFVCLLADGRLFVADGQEMNPRVLSYCARLERMNRPYRTVFASMEMIRLAYQTAPGQNDGGGRVEHTQMQVLAKDLLSKACSDRASDIHIRVKKFRTEILFRVHNDLIKVTEQTREYGERLLATLYGAMTSVSDSSYKPTERQDASIADRDKLPDRLYGVRIATSPTSEGNVMVLRLLYNDAGDDIDLRPLGFCEAHAAAIQTLKEQPIGMNIISGPTGSGKSTTLQRVLSGEIIENLGRLHVITVEDPVEYPIDGAVQTPVTNAGTEEERSRVFSAAIANAMRLDPDTIMIGEIRDRASAQSALRAAMTGHQVWTTVHANSAMAIVDRLVDLGLPLSMVADPSVVTGLISQRLVKLLCQNCKRRLRDNLREVSQALLDRLDRATSGDIDRVCITGNGCSQCRGQGTTGRTVVAEIIIPDQQFFEHLREGKKSKAFQYWLSQLGGRTIVEHAVEKVMAGLVDPATAEKTVGHLISVRTSSTRIKVVEAAHAG